MAPITVEKLIDEAAAEPASTEQAESLRCPACQQENEAVSEFCSACRLHFETGLMPTQEVDFPSPEVEFAYQPSGKSGLVPIVAMLAGGLAVAAPLGAVSPFVHQAIKDFAVFIGQSSGLFRILIGFLGPPAVSLVVGVLIGFTIGKIAATRHCSSITAARTTAVISALASFAVFVPMRVVFYDRLLESAEAFDHWADFVKVAVSLGCIIFGAFEFSTSSMQKKPFCEACGKFMKYLGSRQVEGWPEDELAKLLGAAGYDRVFEPVSEPVLGNDCRIGIWYCDQCRASGFLDTKASRIRMLDRGGSQPEWSRRTQRIFSSTIDEGTIAHFLTRHALEGELWENWDLD